MFEREVMKINELNFSQLKQGLRFRGLKTPEKLGTIVFIDYMNDCTVNYKWDDEDFIGLWFGVDCECEVIEDENKNFVIDSKKISKEDKYSQKRAEEALLKYYAKVKFNINNKLYNLKTPEDDQEKISLIADRMLQEV